MKQQKTGENKYIPADIEAKWQEKWESDKVFSPDIKNAKDPYFNLMMFPYPSAEGLHVGNMYAFTGADVYAKFNRMQGNDVLEPIGLDGFGIHSENYALKVGRHPKEQATLAEKNFYRQMRSIGNSFDWQRTVETYNPNYYKWTQWLFVTLFKEGLAYRDTALVNWCPKDLTVLSDEQVIDGCCERCGTKVEKKNLEQWFFRITKYADRLLQNIEGLDWSNKVKIAQTNWIGKSEGAEVEFRIKGQEVSIKVFTTRPDTLYGATFMVIAPEHPLVASLLNLKFKISNLKLKNKELFVLVDGFMISSLTLPQQNIIRGDSLSISIAAASIIAKVERDMLMDKLGFEFPNYKFEQHKGYGTALHRKAISSFGVSQNHRIEFCKKTLASL